MEGLRISHRVVDGDQWYSCPAAKDQAGERLCTNDAASDLCDCGADKHNAQVEQHIALLRKEVGVTT
jgi:hypothetical protein